MAQLHSLKSSRNTSSATTSLKRKIGLADACAVLTVNSTSHLLVVMCFRFGASCASQEYLRKTYHVAQAGLLKLYLYNEGRSDLMGRLRRDGLGWVEWVEVSWIGLGLGEPCRVRTAGLCCQWWSQTQIYSCSL